MIPQSPGDIAIALGSFSVRWYGICLAIAAMIGVAIVVRLSRDVGLKRDHVVDAALWSIVCGFMGARLWHVWNEWWYYGHHLSEIGKMWEGGLALHGGMLFGFIALFAFTRYKKIDLVKLLDVTAIGLIAAQAIGRIGNYFNQELFGRPSTAFWSIAIAPEKRPLAFAQFDTFEPLFLYELILNALLATVLYRLWRRHKTERGLFVGAYLIGYGGIRFCLDFLRLDQFGFWGMTLAQWVSAGMILAGAYLVWRLWKKQKVASDKSGA